MCFNRRGVTVIYVVIAILIMGMMLSYSYFKISNSELKILNYMNEIKKMYEEDLIDSNGDGVYEGVSDYIYGDILPSYIINVSD